MVVVVLGIECLTHARKTLNSDVSACFFLYTWVTNLVLIVILFKTVSHVG